MQTKITPGLSLHWVFLKKVYQNLILTVLHYVNKQTKFQFNYSLSQFLFHFKLFLHVFLQLYCYTQYCHGLAYLVVQQKTQIPTKTQNYAMKASGFNDLEKFLLQPFAEKKKELVNLFFHIEFALILPANIFYTKTYLFKFVFDLHRW